MGCACADYDNDGDIDLYVTNLGPNVLYRNNADGTFTDVSVDAGLHNRYANGLGIVCGDFNGDELPDCCVANDLMANQLWINQGNGTFRDATMATARSRM